MFHGTHRLWFALSSTSLSLLTILLTTVSCISGTAGTRPADPLVGTWVMNAQRSKFNPGPAPRSITVTYEQVPQGLHVVNVTVISDGTSSRSEYTAGWDGKDVPITGVPQVETTSMRQIDALTSERIDKRGGQRVQSYMRQVYADGRTMIVTQKGTDASGSAVDNTIVLEKKVS
jgi:hypothetical protein